MISKFGFIMAMIIAISLPVSAYSADYPTKAITLQVPWPAGGAAGVGAHILATIAEKKMGQPIIVINKPGAGSQVGLTELAKARPDGYYIGSVTLPTLSTVILDPERKAVFDIDSFIPIINQVMDPGVIWVKADSPYKTLKEVLDDAKKRPGVVRASTTGILGDDHLAIIMMEEAAKVRFRIVHFDGGAPQMVATLGGQVDVSFDNVGNVAPRLKSGHVRALAVMDKESSKFMPDVPTTMELGYPSVISSATRGYLGPKGMPEPIVKKIQEIFLEAINHPDHVEKMNKAALTIKPMVGEEYGKYIRDLHATAKILVNIALRARQDQEK